MFRVQKRPSSLGPGEYTFDNAMGPLQVVALVTRSREEFEKRENNAVELVGIFH